MTGYNTPTRGFTLLIAVVLASVALSLGLALIDIAYKQSVLASAAKQSQTAFYNADMALECALFYDQQKDFFNTNPFDVQTGDVKCNNLAVTFTNPIRNGSTIETIFTVPCAGGGTAARVTVRKNENGAYDNAIYANGYNTCDTSHPRRIERGLRVTY